MKIEIGEYIRTKQGDISKVKYVDEENIFLEDSVWSKNDLYEKTNVLYFEDDEIAKHSKDIIGLIEVGDYVNGQKVISITKVSVWTNVDVISKKQIKSIITEEQFSNMEYKINE